MPASLGLTLYNLGQRPAAAEPSTRPARPAGRLVWLHAPGEGLVSPVRALARRLVELEMQLDQATRLARRSLLLGEDPQLREQLSSWFASLGRLALAAGTLEPLLDRQLSGPERTRLWIRIAVLRARAGEAEASAEALTQAAKADRGPPLQRADCMQDGEAEQGAEPSLESH